MASSWRKIKTRLSGVFNRAAEAPLQPVYKIAPSYKIAIVGAGTAGLAAAAFLKQSGHEVALFEKNPSPGPVGAGLLLQPTGLSVLSRLGLDQEAIARGSVVHKLTGSRVHDARELLDIRYDRLSPNLFGVGIHRGALFSLLYGKVKELGIPVTMGAEITGRGLDDQGRSTLQGKTGETYGPFDLVIDAQGLHSALRRQFAKTGRDKPYPYGALWGVVRDEGGAWRGTLTQKYEDAQKMIGVLPLGRPDPAGPELAAFFFSLKKEDYAAWKQGDFDAWKKDVAALWPEAAPLVAQFSFAADLTFGGYSDIVLKRFHAPGIAFIGDAAHATSPQLGQGANMALVDAFTLDKCLKERKSLDKALASYTKERLRHVHFYQFVSRRLTPFFQGDRKLASRLRDVFLGPLCKAPGFRGEMAKTLSGVKTGPFSQLNPGAWGKAYDTKTRGPKPG